MKMNIFDFVKGLNGDFIKKMLLQRGVPASDIEGVDFSNMDSLNALAEKIMPGLIKQNPNIANMIKQNSSMLGADKQKEVVEVIDKV